MPAVQATPELSAAFAAQPVEQKPGAYYSYYDTNNDETAWARQRRRQRWIWRGIAVAVTVVIAAVIAIVVVFVTRKQNKGQSYYHELSPYANLTRVASLDAFSATSATGNRTAATAERGRVFVVGDIHGCLDEFNALVSKLGYTSNDTLILTGDLIAKGPDSPGVLRRAIELGAKCVRGNHDDKVVRFRTYMNEQHTQELKDTLPEGNVPDPLRPNNYHASIARALTEDEYGYLASCPMVLELPAFQAYVVHAGLDPGHDINAQDPYFVMNMRTLNDGMPSADKQGTLWADVWNQKQEQVNATEARKVYFGHAASHGLDLRKYSFALDTGCVYGRQLTAMEITSGNLTQVECKTAYATHK